jgi:hypothetical protein
MATSPAPSGRDAGQNAPTPYSPTPGYAQRPARPAPAEAPSEVERLRAANRRLLRLLGQWQYSYEWAMRTQLGQTYANEIQAHLDHYLHQPYVATISLLSQEIMGGD